MAVILIFLIFLAHTSYAQATLPPGWSDGDIGFPAYLGSATCSNGLWTVSGNGTDIWDVADQGNLVQQRLGADGSIVAQVTSLLNSDPATGYSKAGIMFRNDSSPGAINVFITVTANQGVLFQLRNALNGYTTDTTVPGITAPVWLKLTRAGDQFTGFYSADGTNWSKVGNTTTVEMSGTALAGLAVTSHNSSTVNTATFTNVSLSASTFGVYRELWTNLDSDLYGDFSVLTNTDYNPDWPDNPVGFYTHTFSAFETENDLNMNFFGQRVRTFIVPPANGLYTFWIASDDSSQLFLSSDENPTNSSLIASVATFTAFENWTNFPAQQSAYFNLQAGRRYYLEADMLQATGNENLSVRWQLPNYSLEQPIAAVGASGTLMIPCNGVDSPPGIFSQSSNVVVIENSDAALSVLVTNQAAVGYQWFSNGIPITNAINSVYAFTNASLLLNQGQTYTCLISNSVGSLLSAPISFTVIPDIVAPTISSVFNIGTKEVQIVFSEPISGTQATNLANYVFGDGTAITQVTLGSDQQTVTLTTGTLAYTTNYIIIINNISDLASTPNVILQDTFASFTALPYPSFNVGASLISSSVIPTASGITVTAAGSNIGGYSDQFNFNYQAQNGDFDVTVCLASLGLSDLWAQAGIMARANLDAASPFAATLATPGLNGVSFLNRASTPPLAVTSGNFPVNYPNTWLRLSRVGDLFTGFGSYDGTNWTQLGSVSMVFPTQVYLGLAVASDNTNQATTAQFTNFETTLTNAVINPTVNPHEPISPSSRKTGIIISEIMYKPAARTDGNNVEFLELFNSNPFFQDISNYKVTCADMSYTFPSNTLIPGGAFFVVAASPSGIANVYGITSNVFGPYTGSLKKTETLQLFDEQTNLLLTIPYTSTYPWPVAADGTGHSIILANPSYGEGDPRAWDISDTVGGSPGRLDPFAPSPLRSVVINELLPHSENTNVSQFIELYNHSLNNVDISGCILTDDFTTNKFVVPAGTLIGPAGFIAFTQSQLGFVMNGAGGTLYFIKPDQSRILDSVQFSAQADGVSFGRWPDGANDFYAFTTNTPGTNNSAILIGNIVINELMYEPISGNDDDQFIELYNQGPTNIDLSNWQLASAVTFTFPAGTSIAPNGYLVVSRNLTSLFAKYPNLNSANTIGDYSGKLSHNGETLTLIMPKPFYGTNTIYVTEDQVSYGTGGRWGEWSSGGGSSLELIDPHSNHRLAANWADSDESQKSSWVNIENTGVLDNGCNYEASIAHAQIGILDVGDCLVDDIEVDYNGTNLVINPGFEAGFGLNNWSLQGCMTRSSLENSGYNSSYSLHIRNSDRFWTGVNSCQMELANSTLQSNQTATLRFKARWLHGWPEAILRLNGNWLEATGALPVPTNLGTPGGPNSVAVTNAGPAIYNVTHVPAIPAVNESAVVTVKAHDPDGIQNLTLYYRIDPASNYTAVPMVDDGTGGDAIAGDGVFSAAIPGQAGGVIAAYYVAATDSLGASTVFPAIRTNDNEPTRECLVMFGDNNPGGSFGAYHLWIDQTNINRWAALSDLSNEGNDCTFVNNNRVIYNMQGKFSGSPFHQDFDTPVGNLCTYKWVFNDDDKFLGATDFNKIHQPGNIAGDDLSVQREQLANTFLRALGVPWLYKRYVAVFINGIRRGSLMEDTQVPGTDVVKENFPNDTDGFLYKMQPWFEMAPYPQGQFIAFTNIAWCDLLPFTTTGGIKKPARYRYNFQIRHTPDSASDFTNVFSLIDAANAPGTLNYVANLESLANMENWMRVFAANHAAGNWDVFGGQSGQNVYGYVGLLGTKYSLLMWDFNLVFGTESSSQPGQDLLTLNLEDPNIQAIFAEPTFQRMYWRALLELVNGPLNPAISGPLLDDKYNSFVNSGLALENPNSNIKPWLAEAQPIIAGKIAALDVTNFTVDPSPFIINNTAYVSGQAPFTIGSILINGASYPLSWTSLNDWVVEVPLQSGTNTFTAQGLDVKGHPVAGATGTAGTSYALTSQSPLGQLVFNEIMYAPAFTNGGYIELYNNSSYTSFDLSNWKIPELGYTFPSGSVLDANTYLILAANREAFANAYGSTNLIFDLYSIPLTTAQTLTLVQPVSGTVSNVIAKVQYRNTLPWPTNANGTGESLQLIDSTQDNWRAGNWSAYFPTPGAPNTAATTLPAFQPLWLNEIQPDNLTGITNSQGTHSPWIELYNPTTNSVSLAGLFLSDVYTNLAVWPFPTNAVIGAQQFLIIFLDGLTNLNTASELHAGFTVPQISGSMILSRLDGTNLEVLDYLDYLNVPANESYGSYPDGQSFVREIFSTATPGAANSIGTAVQSSFILYSQPGSVYTQNFDQLPATTTKSVNTDNPVTINGITYALGNPFDFAAPVSSTGSGGLGISSLAGWYGLATVSSSTGTKFGATDGDQTTGGDISFGGTGSGNRALGLLDTSSTGVTAFGARLINNTDYPLNYINIQFTAELWRQSTVAKTVQFYYYIDPSSDAPFSTAATASISSLNLTFPTSPSASGGVAVDGTAAANQKILGVANQLISGWNPGTTLWLTWEMADNTGKAQGMGIDNFSFAANYTRPVIPTALSTTLSGTNITLSFPAPIGGHYQLQFKTNLTDPAWIPIGALLPGNGGTLTFTNSAHGFYRLGIQ